VVAATDAGGTADLRIRTVVASLRRHIPGNPTIIVEYMPGKDPEFLKEYKKTGDDSPPLMPEELEWVIKNLPREPEVVELFKNLFGAGPLPPR
jgi:hypothetical protein